MIDLTRMGARKPRWDTGMTLAEKAAMTAPPETLIGMARECMLVCQPRDMSLKELHEERDRLRARLRTLGRRVTA